MSAALAPPTSFECGSCGQVETNAITLRGLSIARGHHARSHAIDLESPVQRLLMAKSATLRLGVVAAKARIGMWQACPAMDKARDADQVLAEVLALLEDADPPR